MGSKLNNINPRTAFPRVERLLYGLAWDFSARYGMQFEDAKSEAFEGFMKACNNYRPDKGMKFSTWCRFVAWGHMKSKLMQRMADPTTRKSRLVEITERLGGEAPEPQRLDVLLLRDTLPAEPNIGYVLLHLFLESPREIMLVIETLSRDARKFFFYAITSHSKRRPRSRAEDMLRIKRSFAKHHGGIERAEELYAEIRGRLAEVWG